NADLDVVLANFEFAEAVRPDARDEIARLQECGFEVCILSGDRRAKVEAMAAANSKFASTTSSQANSVPFSTAEEFPFAGKPGPPHQPARPRVHRPWSVCRLTPWPVT